MLVMCQTKSYKYQDDEGQQKPSWRMKIKVGLLIFLMKIIMLYKILFNVVSLFDKTCLTLPNDDEALLCSL